MPALPAGISANDVDALASGELVNAVGLRAGISGYTGSRWMVSGAGMLAGDATGKISYGTDPSEVTTWNEVVVDGTGRLTPDRVAFGFLHAVVVRPPGDFAFIGDRQGGYFPGLQVDGALVAVATSSTHALGLRANGTVVAVGGQNFYGENSVPQGMAGVLGVAAGESFSAAVLNNGQVVVWGSDANGVLQVPAAATNVVSIKAGAAHLVALRSDGTVVAWGNPADGRTSVPAGLNRVKKVAVGRAHTLALRDDGTVVAWGYNGSGQTSVPIALANVIDIAAGGNHNIALVSREKPLLSAFSAGIAGVPFDLAAGFVEKGQVIRMAVNLDNGAPPVQYRWRRNGNLVQGATNSTLDVTVGPAEGNTISIDVEAINAFGIDQKSVALKVGTDVYGVAARIGTVNGGYHLDVGNSILSGHPQMAVGAIWFPGGFTAMGRGDDGGYLTGTTPDFEAIFEVQARGNPAPTVDLWTASPVSPTRLVGSATVTGATSTEFGKVFLKPGILLNQPTDKTRYWLVVKNPLGPPVTNEVSLTVYSPPAVPSIVSEVPRLAGVNGFGNSSVSPFLPLDGLGGQTLPTSLGPIPSGTSTVTLSVDPNYVIPADSKLQWLAGSTEIPGATNAAIVLNRFSYPQVKPYSLRIRSPLYGVDATRGQVISSSLTPVLAVAATLNKTNLTGSVGSTGKLDLALDGALAVQITYEKQNSVGTWVADSTFVPGSNKPDIITTTGGHPAYPYGWVDGGAFWLNLDALGGKFTLSVGTSSLSGAQKGNYRIVVRQMSHYDIVRTLEPWVLNNTTQYAYFTVSVNEPASLALPASSPVTPIAGGGTWLSGSGQGVDMTVAAKAYSTIDLGAYLTTGGSPSPNFRWEKQTSAGQFAVVSRFTNSPALVLSAVPANSGIYRVTATNLIGGTVGVSKLIALNVDRVLTLTNGAMVFPDGTVDIPVTLTGFGDESVLSFTLQVDSPYISAALANVTMALDPSLVTNTSLSFRTTGSVDAAPAPGGAGGNSLKVQVLVSKNDPTKTFPAGTNRLGSLTLKAQNVTSIGAIRSGSPIPPLESPIQVLSSGLAAGDLPLRIALTNATLTSLTAEPGSIRVLADSLEGDVDGNFSVNITDVTALANVLASGTVGSFSSVLSQSRLDVAPMESSGDLAINLADLVQVARYAARLDALKPAGGPTGTFSLNGRSPVRNPRDLQKSMPSVKSRRVRLGWADVVAGQEVWVPVMLSGQGDENAMAFNIEFDPAILEYQGLRAPVGTAQMDNSQGAGAGRVGVLLWKAAGKAMPAGEGLVAELGFRVKATTGNAKIRFGSLPVDSLIATVDARPVTSVQYEGGDWSIAPRRRVVGGRLVSQQMTPAAWNLELQTIDSAGIPVSARNRSLRVQAADRLDALEAEWAPVGVTPEVTPLGTLRIPLPTASGQSTRFFRVREE